MANNTGLSPNNPSRYLGASVYLSQVVTRTRAPTGADYRQPETGKLYPFATFWLVGKNPTTGVYGDLWYLSNIVANVGNWLKLSTGGSGPVLGVDVDAHTAPGTDPVLTNASGIIAITGAQVASGIVGTNVIRTNSLAANAFTIQIQRTGSAAATDVTLNGVAHFNSAEFVVDANGFVSLVGGSAAIDSINVDAHTAPGTDPVLPDGTGQITVTGAQVAAGVVGANAIRTDSLSANAYKIEIQRSAAATSSSVNNNGISSYDDVYFDVDSNGFVQLDARATPFGVHNLGFSYTVGTGTFTVSGYNGTALSATNPAFIWIQDGTAGLMRKYTVTANQSFIDDNGASQIIGNRFGMSTGVAVTVNVPFYLYAATNDAQSTVTFGISRIPHMITAPAVGNIGTPSSSVADTQGSLFLFSSVTVADYDTNPVLCLGSFEMRMSNLDDWTVQTLIRGRDGIGLFQEGNQFTFPRGQFGAAAAKVFANNGGTAPDDADGGYAYYVDRDGTCTIYMAFPAFDTAGVGAVTLEIAFPFVVENGGTGISGFTSAGGTTSLLSVQMGAATSLAVSMRFVNNAGDGTLTNGNIPLNAEMGLGGDYIISKA